MRAAVGSEQPRKRPGQDHAAAERAAAAFLTALGIALDSEELRDTPGRMARSYAELCTAPPLRLTTFPDDEGYDEPLLARVVDYYAADRRPRSG